MSSGKGGFWGAREGAFWEITRDAAFFFFFFLHPSVCLFVPLSGLRRFGKLAVDSRDEDCDEVGGCLLAELWLLLFLLMGGKETEER